MGAVSAIARGGAELHRSLIASGSRHRLLIASSAAGALTSAIAFSQIRIIRMDDHASSIVESSAATRFAPSRPSVGRRETAGDLRDQSFASRQATRRERRGVTGQCDASIIRRGFTGRSSSLSDSDGWVSAGQTSCAWASDSALAQATARRMSTAEQPAAWSSRRSARGRRSGTSCRHVRRGLTAGLVGSVPASLDPTFPAQI